MNKNDNSDNAQATAANRPPVIDMHLHAFDLEFFKARFEIQSKLTPAAFMQKTFQMLERFNITCPPLELLSF